MLAYKALLYLLIWTWLVYEITSRGEIRRGNNGVNAQRRAIFTPYHREMHSHEDPPQSRKKRSDRGPIKHPYGATLNQSEDSFQADQDDLGIRFSKIVFPNGTSDATSAWDLPLTKDDYPIDIETAMWLRNSQCGSIIIPANCYECDTKFETLIEKIHGEPTHPSRNPDSPYWAELREVTRVQAQRLSGMDPREIMPIPKIWENFTIEEVAEAVHDEYPGAVQVELIKSLMKDRVKVDNTTIPLRCNVEFLRGIVMLAELNTWAIGTVGPTNFGIKYYAGRARPEEVAFLISEGELTSEDGVPDDLLMDIPLHSLEKAVDYTAYPEGSPMHPSWPAMHSAASSASFWLGVVLNLTPEQSCQAKLVDYGVAYARTVAGVHYPGDNIAGLNLGQEIIASKLPEHLAHRYGSDPTIVRQKIDSLRFDWRDFLDSDCAKNFPWV